MKRPITRLRSLLSFLGDVKIEQVNSPINGKLTVVLSEGRCMLNTANATYSFEEKYTSFSKALSTISTHIATCRSALVLGLGLGSVPYILQSAYRFSGPITCVEIDPMVIALAKRYYPASADLSKLHIEEADAVDWIATNTARFDLIIGDVFLDARVPEALHSIGFLQNLRRTVAPGGILLFSRILDRQRFERTLWDNLRAVFPEAEEIDTGGNVVMCFRG